MLKEEYFIYAIRNKLLHKMKWFFAVFGTPASDIVKCEYYVYENGKYTVNVDGKMVELSNVAGSAMMSISDTIELTSSIMSNITDKVTTTVGKAIANYLLVYEPFNGKIPYMDGEVSVKKIENIVLKNRDTGNGGITIPEYKRFVNNSIYITSLSRLVSVAATERNILPPPGIEEYKNKTIAEMKAQYGEDVFKSYVRVAELENKLKEYDTEYLKGDPSLGKLVSGKVKNTARTKMYLMYGAEPGFDRSGVAMLVENSLSQGWPKDAESLARLYNVSRSGSFDRGAETQKGGVVAKIVLRATNSIVITTGEQADCGTKFGKEFLVASYLKDRIIGRNIIEGSGYKELTYDNIDNYVGRYVTLRSPAYCKQKDGNICSVCAGPRLTEYKTGISLLVLIISSILLDISMFSMHSKELKTIDVDIDEMFK